MAVSSPPPAGAPSPAREELPRLLRWLGPVVDAVAALNWSVHRKLLFGFLSGALLLVVLAALSLVVIDRMSDRVLELERHQEKADIARQMLYKVTAQSHYRGMELLLAEDDRTEADEWGRKIVEAKKDFADLTDQLARVAPGAGPFVATIRRLDTRYARASAAVTALYEQGRFGSAAREHLRREHTVSHKIEPRLEAFISAANAQQDSAQRRFQSDQRLLRNAVVAFAVVSVLVAVALGLVLSWAFTRPVRKMQSALASLSTGDFARTVEVPNRDEFGSLTRDLNATSSRLRSLFTEQRMLADELALTNSSLIRASEAKSQFLTNVSHELRTPLNAILGFTDALLAGVDGPLNEDQTTSLGWVQKGGRDLLELINEILDLSKIEAGRVTFEPGPFDPRELVESVVAQHRPLAVRKGVRLTSRAGDAPSEVVLDRQRVRQILVNLLGNAVKFTDHGRVTVDVTAEPGGVLHVAVRDTGPGVPPEEQDAVFEEFHQIHVGETGTGLGLPISRRLARAMGGDVTLESEPGQGCAFHLRLPPAHRPASGGNGAGDPAPQATPAVEG